MELEWALGVLPPHRLTVFDTGGSAPPYDAGERTDMQIDKQQIIELLRSRGNSDQADRAQSELPDQVDTDQHADKLSQLGIDPKELLGGLGGGLGDKLGL